MRNITQYQLTRCIYMQLEDFEDLVQTVTNGQQKVVYDDDGLRYETTEPIETSQSKSITELLSDYFDITVTSIHSDHDEYRGIWICYKE